MKNIETFVSKLAGLELNRGGFLKVLLAALAYAVFSSGRGKDALFAAGDKLKPRNRRESTTDFDMAVVKGDDPAGNTRKAVEALGGMGRFVREGDIVVVKPNIGWDRTPEQAGNTNPEVVAELIKLCYEAGAKKVKVFDHPCNNSELTYRHSGIAGAVKKAKGKISYINEWDYLPAEFPDEGYLMNGWPIHRDAATCDCFINVPVAKHHNLTELTLSLKNLMGVCGGRRGEIHTRISRKLVELAEFVKPDLTVIDATRILLRNGPTGGNLEDVAKKDIVIASADPVLADAYATTLFGLQPEAIGSTKAAAEKGLGNMNYLVAKVKKIGL